MVHQTGGGLHALLLTLLCAAASSMSSYLITTIAGTGIGGYSGDAGPALNATFLSPFGIVFDQSGSLFIADTYNNVVRRILPSGIISTYAGNHSNSTFAGDGGPATSGQMYTPSGVAFGLDGSLFIADSNHRTVRRVSPSGIMSSFAGNADSRAWGFGGMGLPATEANLDSISGLAADANYVYISVTYSNVVVRVGLAGIVEIYAGNGPTADRASTTPTANATLSWPTGLAMGPDGSLYVSCINNGLVRRVYPSGVIETVAGTGSSGFSGDGGPATSATLNYPIGVALDTNGTLYIADSLNNRVRTVSPEGIINTIAGGTAILYKPIYGTGVSATTQNVGTPAGVVVAADGSIFVANSDNSVIQRIYLETGTPIPPIAADISSTVPVALIAGVVGGVGGAVALVCLALWWWILLRRRRARSGAATKGDPRFEQNTGLCTVVLEADGPEVVPIDGSGAGGISPTAGLSALPGKITHPASNTTLLPLGWDQVQDLLFPVPARRVMSPGSPVELALLCGLPTQDQFLPLVPYFRWSAAPEDAVAVEEGVSSQLLATPAPTLEGQTSPPPVRLSAIELSQQVELVTGGLIDQGATAYVFKCRWKSRFGAQGLLAAKVMRPSLLGGIDSMQWQAFKDEADILSRMRGHHLVHMYGYCLEPPNVCLILELLPGNLKHWLYGHPPVPESNLFTQPSPATVPENQLSASQASTLQHLSPDSSLSASVAGTRTASRELPMHTAAQILQMGADIALGVAMLHGPLSVKKSSARSTLDADAEAATRVVHRDLKPANILINSAGRPKIIDLGLARMHLDTNAYTSHAGVGTLCYMAPELLQGKTEVLNQHVDMYSLGVLLWELVAQQTPWKGCADSTVLALVVAGQRPSMESEGISSSEGLMAAPSLFSERHFTMLIRSCWQMDARRRPKAFQVHTQLLRMLTKFPAASEGISPPAAS